MMVTIERMGGVDRSGKSVIYGTNGEILQVFMPKFPEGTTVYEDEKGLWHFFGDKMPEENRNRLLVAEEFYYLTKNILSFSAYTFVLSRFPDSCVKKFKKNPFFLSDISLPESGKVCSVLDVDRGIVLDTFEKRVQEMAYIIQHVLDENENDGHTWILYDELSKRVKYVLAKDGHPLRSGNVGAYLRYHSSLFYFDGERVANKFTYEKERSIYEKIKYANSIPTPFPLFSHTNKEGFADAQNLACQNLITKGGHFSILTGGPGTGKTTITAEIVDEVLEQYPESKIYLLASTGKASRRIKEVFGDRNIEIMTVHKFVGYGHRITKRETDIIREANLILVDEASMTDIDIFYRLTNLINFNKTKLILVGDADQLPSVSAGNVLSDLIEIGAYTISLTENYRSNSSINCNAYKINHGELDLVEDENFEVKVVPYEVMASMISEETDADIVLTPYRIEKRDISSENLNKLIQRKLYGEDARGFLPGEAIIMTRTNYKRGYFNGETGNIIARQKDGSYVVEFGDRTINVKNTEDMALGHAITMHKSQGSEYPYAVICIPPFENFITRKMLYTAQTRAKEKVRVYVSSKEDLLKVILNDKDSIRRTFLSSMEKLV